MGWIFDVQSMDFVQNEYYDYIVYVFVDVVDDGVGAKYDCAVHC